MGRDRLRDARVRRRHARGVRHRRRLRGADAAGVRAARLRHAGGAAPAGRGHSPGCCRRVPRPRRAGAAPGSGSGSRSATAGSPSARRSCCWRAGRTTPRRPALALLCAALVALFAVDLLVLRAAARRRSVKVSTSRRSRRASSASPGRSTSRSPRSAISSALHAVVPSPGRPLALHPAGRRARRRSRRERRERVPLARRALEAPTAAYGLRPRRRDRGRRRLHGRALAAASWSS